MFDLMTVTLNPALDLSANSGLVVPGPKLRLGAPTVEPGGGGVNVARAATNLGGRVLAVAALGGVTGARMAELLGNSGVTVAAFQLDGETRQSLSVTERETGKQFRFILPGPNWTPAQVEAVFSRLSEETRHLVPGAIVVLSGSQPPACLTISRRSWCADCHKPGSSWIPPGPRCGRWLTTRRRGPNPMSCAWINANPKKVPGANWKPPLKASITRRRW